MEKVEATENEVDGPSLDEIVEMVKAARRGNL